jgi:hypothetical protein
MTQTSLCSFCAGNLTSQGLPGASGRVLTCPVIASYCTKALGLALAVSRR